MSSRRTTFGRSIHPPQDIDIMIAHRFIGRRLTIGLGLVLLLMARPAAAQTSSIQEMFTTGGEQPDRGLVDGLPFERIDPMTGNLALTFDDVVLPGNAGKSVHFMRHYNSSTHTWSFGVAGIPLSIEDNGDPTLPDMHDLAQRTPTFAMADGGVRKGHYVHLSVIGPQRFRWVVTSDNWLYDRQTRVLYLPDGTRGFYVEELSGMRLTEIRDVYGNVTAFSDFVNDRQVITQRLGNDQNRELEIFRDPTTRNVIKVTSEGRQWNYVWDPARSERLLRADMPAGPDWVFGYGTNEMTVQAPGGGTVRYTFTEHVWYTTGEAGGPTFSFFPVTGREILPAAHVTPGVWTYSYNMTATGGISTDTAINGPNNLRTTYTHKLLIANGIDPKWGVTARIVETVNGATIVEHERETFVYDTTRGPWLQSNFAASRLRQKTIAREGRSYVTDYQFRSTGAPSPIDYLSPSVIVETGPPAGSEPGLVRTTARTYDFTLGPSAEFGLVEYLTGFLKSETVMIGAESHVTTYGREPGTGFITSLDRDGMITTFTKNEQGNVRTEKNARSHESTYTYSWGVRSGETSSVAAVTRDVDSDSTVNSEKRRGVGAVDPGADDPEYTTHFTYDALSRLKDLTPPIGNTVTTTYDNATAASMTRQRGTNWLTTYYDGFGRVIGTRNVNGIVTRMTYDANGRITYRSYPYDGGSSSGLPGLPAIRVGKAFTYDALGRPLSEGEPGAPPSRVEYSRDTVRAYDENANPTEMEYRAFGHPDDRWLVRVNDPDGKNWTYTYNALGALARVTAPDGLARTWGFDVHGWINGTTMPESGTMALTHDEVGNVRSKTDARQTVSTFTYDAHNRPIGISAVRAGASSAETTVIRYQRGSESRRRISNAHVITEYSFDAGGRPTERRDTIGGRVPLVTHYEYDGNDNLKSVRYPSGRLVEYAYDSGNRVTEVFETMRNGRTVRYAYEVAYHPSGAVKSYKAGNGITHAITYDEQRYWTKTIRSAPLSLDYQFDHVGNIKVITDSRADMSQTFTYDTQDRLIEARAGSTAPGSAWYGGIVYGYDEHGNRKTVPGDMAYSYWPGTLRLKNQGTAQFTYDENGNRLTAPYRTYTYNAENMIETASGDGRSTAYRYDADELRKERTVNGATTLFVHGLGTKLLTELSAPADGVVAVTREYVYLGGRLIASVVPPDGAQPIGQSVRLIRPVPSVDYEVELPITIEALPFTPAGTTTRVEFFADGQKLGEKATAPWTFVWTPTTPATYQLTAKATNSLNDHITSPAVPIVVKAPQPNVAWTVAAQTVEEPGNPAVACSSAEPHPFTAELILRLPSGPLGQEITVEYSVSGGSYLEAFATEDRDYTAPPEHTRTVTFQAGTLPNTRRTIDLGILHDCKDEADETFELRIVRVIGANGAVIIGATRTQTVTIVDNDEPPTINISQDVTVNEANRKVTLLVSLSAASGRLVSVDAATVLPAPICTFFTEMERRLTFVEDGPLSLEFTVPLEDNQKGNEPARSFHVDLTSATAATIGRGRATVVVEDEAADAVASLDWPGNFLANVHQTGTRDYVLITNPFNRSVAFVITTVFDNGGAARLHRMLGPHARLTFRLDEPMFHCEAGTSIAVQVANGDLLGVYHAGYVPHPSDGPEGGVSSEGMKRASTWYFAEGHTGWGREAIDVFNPGPDPIRVTMTMHGPDGLLAMANPIDQVIPGLKRRRFVLNAQYGAIEHGITVRATTPNGQAPATMVATRSVFADPELQWRGTLDGHASSGVSEPTPRAYLAEGHTGGALRTYLLLLNTTATPTTVNIRYIHENGGNYSVQYRLEGHARLTVEPGQVPLPGGGFGYEITTNPAVPIVAERAMYTNPGSKAGHAGVASPTPSGVRAFPEGAIVGFETHFLVANPNPVPAHVVFEFYDEAGARYQHHAVRVEANARLDVNATDALSNHTLPIFHTIVSSSQPVVTERVSYWPTRAAAHLVAGMTLPFTPAAQLLAVPRMWTPPPPENGEPLPTYTYTPAPYTLVGPEWSPGALAQANATPAPSLRAMTSLASGDAWFGAHLSGGWQVSATPRIATLTLESSTSSVQEGAAATMQIRLTTVDQQPLMANVTATYTVAGGSPFPATPGVDFAPASASVLFLEGEPSGTAKTITIATLPDSVSEYAETVVVELGEPIGPALKGTAISRSFMILDDDLPPTFSVNDVTVSEAGTHAVFTVSLSAVSGMDTAVTARTSNGTARAGTEYATTSQEISLPRGTLSATFSVPLSVDDARVEPAKQFYVDLTLPVHATIARGRGTATILDNDGTHAAVDLSLPTLLVPDATSAAGVSDYIQIFNPHAVALTARVVYTRPDGTGATHNHPVAARTRLTLNPYSQPDVGGQGPLSIAVQSTTQGAPLVVEHVQYSGASDAAGASTRASAPAATWYFAEGAANSYFDEYLTVYNPTNEPVIVTVTLYPEGGGVPQNYTYPIDTGPGRLRIHVNALQPFMTHGTKVTARRQWDSLGSPIAVEREMVWAYRDRREASRSSGSPTVSNTWSFAEGAKGIYSTYLLLMNPSPSGATVNVSWVAEPAAVYTESIYVAPLSRLTVEPPAIVPNVFGIHVSSPNTAIVAERSVYAGEEWEMGHSEVGAPTRALRWLFAEGATGYFDAMFMLVNPSSTPANVTLTYRKENGSVVTQNVTVQAWSRQTVSVDTVPGMDSTIFATDLQVTNGVPIVAERVMYWPGSGWIGSHAALGSPW